MEEETGKVEEREGGRDVDNKREGKERKIRKWRGG